MIDLFDKSIIKILTLFSTSPGSRLNRKTIQEKTRINNIVLDKTLNVLLNAKILLKEKNIFYINFQNEASKDAINILSQYYNKLKHLPLKEYFIIMDIKLEFAKVRDIGDVYLFGSYSKLVFNENSDIDIAIISEQVKKEEIKLLIRKFEKKYKKIIEVHYFSNKFYKNKRDPLVKEILQNGVKLI